jgi:DNA processing protein
VIEANEKSGSLITASCALDQGREVMAVPGNVLSGRNRGAHALIRDGAKIVEDADDIVGEIWPNACRFESPRTDVTDSQIASSGDSIVCRMEAGHAYDLDDLVELSGIESRRLMSRLMELELQGQIRRVGGGRFIRP